MLKIVFTNSLLAKFTAFWEVFKENKNQDVITEFIFPYAATQHIGNIPKLFL